MTLRNLDRSIKLAGQKVRLVSIGRVRRGLEIRILEPLRGAFAVGAGPPMSRREAPLLFAVTF